MKNIVKMTLVAMMALGNATFMTSCEKEMETAANGLLKPLTDMADKWDEEDKQQHLANLENWTSGPTDEEAIQKFGYDNCFKVVPLAADYWENPTSPDLNPNIDRTGLCEVRSLSYALGESGNSELRVGSLICDKRIAYDLLTIFRTLYEEKYPVEGLTTGAQFFREQLMSANLTVAYFYDALNPRAVDQWQQQGLAVDLNPAYPPTDGNDKAVQLFKQFGFIWGGDTPGGKRYRFERTTF